MRKPVPKVQAVGTAGAVITGIVALLAAFGIVVPEEISDAALAVVVGVTAIVTFVAGYLKKDLR